MIKDIIEKNEGVKANDKEMSVLKEYFPSCFGIDGNFDIVKFQELIKDKVDITKEGYELNFLGKSYAKLLASINTTTVIQPDVEHNSKPENKDSENIYISGDNLDALKHLTKSYAGLVKCIYIDPPYNTGSDGFVYNDKFDFTVEDLVAKLSISEDEAKRILELTKRGSASHSAWLTFMYPRLLLARDMLKDDGAIFISIDDNEQSNIKLLCDYVFGEENFISELIWEKKKKGSYLATAITNIKEYVFVYSKKKEIFKGLIGEINSETETYPCVNATNSRDVRVIPQGTQSKYGKANFNMKAGEIISDTTMNLVLKSDLVIKDGILDSDLIVEGNWRYSQDAMTQYAKNGEIYITRDLYLRRIVTEPRNKGLKDLLLRVGNTNESGYSYDFDNKDLQKSGWGSNEDADEEQRILFGEQSIMSYPKPVLLIMKLIASMQQDNMIILDFFSGSATTAEAVLRQTLKGCNYKYIMVQLPESLDKKISSAVGEEKKNIEKAIAFLDSISRKHYLDEIGQERIIRAAAKIKAENPDADIDYGFKHYTLIEPNADTLDKLETFEQNSMITDNNLLNEFGKETVLATWINDDGYGLTTAPQEIDFAGYTAYFIGKHLYLLDANFDYTAQKALFEKYGNEPEFNPENIVLFGYSFSKWTILDSLQTNLRQLPNKKINFDIRY